MMSRKFSGNWNGSERTSVAELHRKIKEFPRIHLTELGEAHPAEPGKEVRHGPLKLGRVGRRQQHPHVPDRAYQAFAVTRCGRDEKFPQAAAGRGRDLAHHAEIDERQLPGTPCGRIGSRE